MVATRSERGDRFIHGERLHVLIKELLHENNVDFNALTGVCVGKGPGSYTGLRIGVSTAKGLCFALNIPLISVPTLEALAHQVENPKGTIVAMLDARRMEVYSAIYDAQHNETRPTEAEVLTSESYLELLELTAVYFIGNGVPKTKDLITHKNAQFIENKLPSAKQMCALSYDKFKTDAFEDVAYFEPFYLKDFIAIPSKK